MSTPTIDRDRSRNDSSKQEQASSPYSTPNSKNTFRGFISDISDKIIKKKDGGNGGEIATTTATGTPNTPSSTTSASVSNQSSLSLSSTLITPMSPLQPTPTKDIKILFSPPSTAGKDITHTTPTNPPAVIITNGNTTMDMESRLQVLNKQTKLTRPTTMERTTSYTKLDEILQSINSSSPDEIAHNPNTFNSLISEEEAYKSESYSALSRNELLRVQNERLKAENEDLKKQLNIIIHDNGEQWENALHLKSIIQELGEYTDQQDSWVKELRAELVTTTEQLLNQESALKLDNERLNNENQSLHDTVSNLDIKLIELVRESRKQNDYSLEAVVQRLRNGVTPSGIERLKSLSEKERLMEEVTKIYRLEFNEDPLFQVIIYFRNILSFKLFIQLLRNNYDALDYYTSYCKKFEKFDDLINIYKSIRNPLEEGLTMVKKAITENQLDVESQLMGLEDATTFFGAYDHLSFYKDSLNHYLNSLRNGVNLNLANVDIIKL